MLVTKYKKTATFYSWANSKEEKTLRALVNPSNKDFRIKIKKGICLRSTFPFLSKFTQASTEQYE